MSRRAATILCAFTGMVVGFFIGALVAGFLLGGNLSGLVGVYVTGPIGLVVGLVAGRRISLPTSELRPSMIENPNQAPQSIPTAVGILSGTRDDLRSVAKSQKGILVCILIQLVVMLSQFALPLEVRSLVPIVVLLVSLVGAFFVFMLAIKVYGTELGVVLGILSLVPCISLIVLLVVNGTASGVLKQNGIKVGLLGANISEI